MGYLSSENQINQQSTGIEDETIRDIPDFPYDEYNSRLDVYREYERWYSGDALEEMQNQGGRSVEKYPIRLNPIRGAALKHAYALFGEYNEDARPLVNPYIRRTKDRDKSLIAKILDVLNDVWYESSGRSIQMKNGIWSQIYGGCIFVASYVPEESWRKYGVKIEPVHPINFCGTLIPGEQFRLSEMWVIREITQSAAKNFYGVIYENENIIPRLVEYWSLASHRVYLNGKIATKTIGNVTKTYDEENPWGFVPGVYIPHIPATNGFYGDSLITESLKGIEKEINLRAADYGDAVSDDAHRYAWVKNNSGDPTVKTVGTMPTIFLGSNPSVTGKEMAPEIGMLGEVRSSVPMATLNEELYKHFRREANVPAVADGEDEGSQRSSLTLTTRMFPLMSHARQERVLWADGMSWFNNMLARIISEKSGSSVISKEALKLTIESKFAPILPREKTDIVNELVSRASANLGDIESLLTQLDDIEDPAAEKEKIKEWLEFLAELEASKYQNMNQQNGSDPLGGDDPAVKATGPSGIANKPKKTPKKENV